MPRVVYLVDSAAAQTFMTDCTSAQPSLATTAVSADGPFAAQFAWLAPIVEAALLEQSDRIAFSAHVHFERCVYACVWGFACLSTRFPFRNLWG